MNLCIKTKYLKPNLIGSLLRYSTPTEVVEQNEQVLIDDAESTRVKEAEIEKKRNKSGLTQAHFNIMNGRKPYETPLNWAHLTVKYNRKMYGKYGSASGVDPSLCWPTKEEIQETMEYESVAYPYSIREMMETAAQKRKQEQMAIEEREKELAVKYAKLQHWKKELQDKIAKKTADAEAAKEKKERLVEEVRRYFGFKLDPRDERFQEMLAKREKEQKKLEKQAKKEAKEKMMIAKLQQQNVQMSEKTKQE